MSEPAKCGAVIYSSDVDKLALFYIEYFGMALIRDEHEFKSLDINGFNIIIHVPPIEIPSTKFNTVKLFLTVDNLDQARSKIEGMGGKSLDGEWSNPFFKMCNISDPEGNHIQIREFTQ